jgi:hypothetical protein
MPRKPRQSKPASASAISARVRAVLRFLPVDMDELRASVVLHPDDEPLFVQALDELLAAGVVALEPQTGWYAVQASAAA